MRKLLPSLAIAFVCLIIVGCGEPRAETAKDIRKAAERGDAEAQFNVGVMYDTGDGVDQNNIEATKWYRKAAEQGHAKAQLNLGNAYSNGRGVIEDPIEAAKWYRKAANKGLAGAQYHLGFKYEKGDGVDQNITEAFKWYRKAADQGFVAAQNHLSMLYLFRKKGIPEDYVTGYTWLILAAAQAVDQSDVDINTMLKDEYAKSITEEQIDKAQKLAREWLDKHDQ